MLKLELPLVWFCIWLDLQGNQELVSKLHQLVKFEEVSQLVNFERKILVANNVNPMLWNFIVELMNEFELCHNY